MQRPKTLAEVAIRSTDSYTQFQYNVRNWIHELILWRDKTEALKAVTQRPPSLAKKYKEGKEADALLAAYAEHTCQAGNRGTRPQMERGPNQIPARGTPRL